MAPKDTGDGGPDGDAVSNLILDWDWITGLDSKSLDQDEIEKLVPILTEWDPDQEEETER